MNEPYIKWIDKVLIKALTKGKEEKIPSYILLKLIAMLLHKHKRKKGFHEPEKIRPKDGAVTR